MKTVNVMVVLGLFTFVTVVPALALFGQSKQVSSDAIAIRWNGKTVDAKTELPIHPGDLHELAIHTKENRDMDVHVLKTLPCGESEGLTGPSRNDAPAQFNLGPMTASSEYDYEHGVVFRRGYRLMITVRDGEKLVLQRSYSQSMPSDEGERLVPSEAERFVFTAGWPSSHQWELVNGDAMLPVLNLRLDAVVLANPDVVKVVHNSLIKKPLPAVLRITDSSNRVMLERYLTVDGDEGQESVPANNWPNGDYRITLWPKIDGAVWREGPTIVYRRRIPVASEVLVTPFAPWALQRDLRRDELNFSDMRAACAKFCNGTVDPELWEFSDQGALLCQGQPAGKSVELHPQLRGWYAVYARPIQECLIQVGDQDIARRVKPRECPGTIDTFVLAADMTDQPVRVFSRPFRDTGLAGLRFVPVIDDSVRAFQHETRNPPLPLHAVSDWGCYGFPEGTSADQIASIVGGQSEIGLRTIGWSIGRSVLQYHSKLKGTTLFAAPGELGVWRGWIEFMRRNDALQLACDAGQRFDARIQPFLAMNRHYGTKGQYKIHCSQFYQEHPDWRHYRKDGREASSRMSFFFPEVRRERINIFVEVGRREVDGLLVCTCRQVPMLAYNPQMIDAYRKESGVDARTLDASQPEAYNDWIRWRAEHFTKFFRELQAELAPIEKELGRKIPVAVRIPSAGLNWNLAQGLDVKTWCEEKLVQQIQLDPLDDRLPGRGSHDVRPYVDLSRKHGVKILGGIGATWFSGKVQPAAGTIHSNLAYVPALKRAQGLLEAGVDGIEIYETELQAYACQNRWLVPLFGNSNRLRAFLRNSNLEACFPVNCTNAAYGHDNHSFSATWDSVDGVGHEAL